MKLLVPILSGLLMLALLAPTFNSCKKGEEDPFLSLKSRDARITGEWELTKIEGTQVESYGTTTTTTYTYNGTIYTKANNPGTTTTASGTYELTIDKKGAVSYSETYTPSGETVIIKTGHSTWYWVDADKNKSSVVLNVDGNLFSGGIYVVEQLKNKEIILLEKYDWVSGTNSNSIDKRYTFTKE